MQIKKIPIRHLVNKTSYTCKFSKITCIWQFFPSYNLFSKNSSICGINSERRIFFVSLTVVEAFRKNRSAGFISKASAIFTSSSNDGVCRPHSIQPIVEVAQSQASASFSCEMPFSFL